MKFVSLASGTDSTVTVTGPAPAPGRRRRSQAGVARAGGQGTPSHESSQAAARAGLPSSESVPPRHLQVVALRPGPGGHGSPGRAAARATDLVAAAACDSVTVTTESLSRDRGSHGTVNEPEARPRRPVHHGGRLRRPGRGPGPGPAR